MENNKYYTPEIEEFHVGFEFEFQGVDGHWNPTGWDKYTIGTKDGEVGIWRASLNLVQKCYNGGEESIEPLHFRVKHLDREDIESLGFELDGFMYFSTNSFRISKCSLEYGEHQYEISENKQSVWFPRFIGTIKNKSELKKVLKMIGL
tara:strand:+ start:5593 stop:6036 length:444 start_codon:yes stop_codon:yes gene_type:complete